METKPLKPQQKLKNLRRGKKLSAKKAAQVRGGSSSLNFTKIEYKNLAMGK